MVTTNFYEAKSVTELYAEVGSTLWGKAASDFNWQCLKFFSEGIRELDVYKTYHRR